MEYVFETTRAVMNLVASGTLERYPNIRFIAAHAGGTVPYIAARLDEQGGRFDPRIKERAPKGVMYYLKTLYYSTAQATSIYTLDALTKLVDSTHILFGTDLPISPASLIEDSDRILREYRGITAADLERILRGNALQLFPRIARLAQA
jgi:predicted TIM-barrel fold metal-dependent hydrolase